MTPANIADQLVRDEGEVLHVYFDSEGYATIGVGRMIDQRKGGGITHEESRYLLDNDIIAVTSDVLLEWPWAAQLDPVRFAVLQNMAFNMGIEGLCQFYHFLAAMQAGDWPQAGAEMLDSKWAKQVPERAGRLAKQVITGNWQ